MLQLCFIILKEMCNGSSQIDTDGLCKGFACVNVQLLLKLLPLSVIFYTFTEH